MNAPAETAPAPATNPAYLRVLEALVSLNEPAERERIATKADISPGDAGVQLVALAGKRIVVRCPQPKGAPALWSLAVSLSTVRQMVEGMKRAAAEASPAADDRRRIIAAMREIGAPASAFAIAKKSDVEMSNFSLFLEAMAADGVIQRIGGTSGQRPKFALIPSVQSQTPAATDGEPGDGTPAPEPDDTQAEDRRRAVLKALREAPDANADSIASATGLSVSEARFFLHAMAADGIVERIEHENAGAIRRNPTIWRIVDADQPGDTQVVDAAEAAPVPDHSASLDDPDNFGDDEIPPAAAYDATVEAEAKADEAPLIGEDVNSDADVLGGWCADHEMAISPRPVRGDDVAMIVSADGSVSADMPALRFAPPATGAAVASGPCPTVALLIQRANQVTEEAAQRAIDTAEVEALMREEEADIALEMARDARVRGRAVAEIIRFAEQRAGLAGDADPDAVLAAIVELLDGARSAVTGMSLPA